MNILRIYMMFRRKGWTVIQSIKSTFRIMK